MRCLTLFMYISIFLFVSCKNNDRTLDTMGQDIIEIGGPKELPPGIEEEPAAEQDDDEDDVKPSTVTSSGITTKKDEKKTTFPTDARKKLKDIEKIDGMSPEDEEARLEKELAEIYKDTDYKDSAEETTEIKETTTSTASVITDETEKPIGRQRNSFKFAPDSTNKKDVEKFRTSVDDISCKNRQKLSASFTKSPDSADMSKASYMFNIFSFVFMFMICY